MTDNNTNGCVDPTAWAELTRAAAVQEQRQRNVRWTQKDIDETLAFIREEQKEEHKEMLRQIAKFIDQQIKLATEPLIARIEELEAQATGLQAAGRDSHDDVVASLSERRTRSRR